MPIVRLPCHALAWQPIACYCWATFQQDFNHSKHLVKDKPANINYLLPSQSLGNSSNNINNVTSHNINVIIISSNLHINKYTLINNCSLLYYLKKYKQINTIQYNEFVQHNEHLSPLIHCTC